LSNSEPLQAYLVNSDEIGNVSDDIVEFHEFFFDDSGEQACLSLVTEDIVEFF